MKNTHKINQNIYITEDVKIKTRGWYIDDNKIYCNSIDEIHSLNANVFKKIILTTDQYLIKDGVQAIDNDFLEWFVNNPSCEEVEVEDVYKTFLEGDKKSVLEKLIYEHKMFIEKFYKARHRLLSSTTNLGGKYNTENSEDLKNISGESSYLDEYSYLLSIQRNVLADIWLSIERLEELVSR
jgi:hypothetical protein